MKCQKNQGQTVEQELAGFSQRLFIYDPREASTTLSIDRVSDSEHRRWRLHEWTESSRSVRLLMFRPIRKPRHSIDKTQTETSLQVGFCAFIAFCYLLILSLSFY
jgi:hypothetical protein